MKEQKMKKILTFSLAFLVVLLVGCAVSLAQLVGLAISLTAPSLCNGLTNEPVIAQLCTDLLSVLFNVDAGTIEVHSVNGQWVTLTSEPMSFDLLQSTGTPQLMVFKDVPPGRYDKIRVDMESFQIKKKDGTVITAYLPNKELIINANIVVEKKGSSVAQLNLDLAKSLHLTTEKELVFAPVIDVETKKNVAIELPNQQNQKQGTALSIAKDSKITTAAFSTATAKANNIRAIKVKGGTLVEKKRVGMDLDGKMKKDFSLDRSKQLSIQNSKVVFKEPTRNNPATSVEQQSPTGATILPPVTVSKKVISTNNIPQPKDEGFPVVVPEKQTEITIRAIDDQISLGEKASFQLSIKNYANKTVKYSIYSLQSGQGWNVYPSPLKDRVIELRPGQEYTTTIEVAPLENLLAGIYTVGLTIVTDSEEQYQQELKVYFLPKETTTSKELDYSQVKLALLDVDTEWKDTYGKITGFEYEVKNEGASTIKPAYFHFSVEGYNDYEKKVPVTPNLKTIFPRSTTRSLIDVPYGFAYNKAALPDPSNVKVTIVLFDENGRVIATAERRVSLPWVENGNDSNFSKLKLGEQVTLDGSDGIHKLSISLLESNQVKLKLDDFQSNWLSKGQSYAFDLAGIMVTVHEINFQMNGERSVRYEIKNIPVLEKIILSKPELLVIADYSSFADKNQQTIFVPTETFKVTNNGKEAVTLSMTITDLPSGYGAEKKTISLAAGTTSEALTVNLKVPHQQDSGKKQIGTLTLSQNGVKKVYIPVIQETKHMIQFDRVEIEFTNEDSEVQKVRFSETETTYNLDKNVLIGTLLKMTFNVENLFDRDYEDDNSDVEDIELMLEAGEEPFVENLGTYNIGLIKANETKQLQVHLNIDANAQAGEYTLQINLEGEDGEGAKHSFKKELKFKVVKNTDAEKTYVVESTNSGFSPSELKIKVGDSVRFIAADDGRHWVASAAHPTHEAYPGSSISKCNTAERDKIFDACKVLNKDESFQFRFTEKGSWQYHDHLHPTLTGTVVVE